MDSGEARERSGWADGRHPGLEVAATAWYAEKQKQRAHQARDGWAWMGMDGEGLADREEGGILNAEDDPFPMVPVLGS